MSNSYGFELARSSGNTLIGNLAINNGFSGFLLEETTGSTLMLNAARGNGHHGFLIESESENNTFRRNTAELNGGFGFNDNGSGNIFVNNQCNGNTFGPSDPLGIC